LQEWKEGPALTATSLHQWQVNLRRHLRVSERWDIPAGEKFDPDGIVLTFFRIVFFQLLAKRMGLPPHDGIFPERIFSPAITYCMGDEILI
jgi:hypothetical protein